MTDHITCNILQINIYDSNYWKICCIMKSKRHFPLQKKKKKKKGTKMRKHKRTHATYI